MYPHTPGLIPQSGTKGPFLLLFRNAGISRKAGPPAPYTKRRRGRPFANCVIGEMIRASMFPRALPDSAPVAPKISLAIRAGFLRRRS
jgi:hypothetical protein